MTTHAAIVLSAVTAGGGFTVFQHSVLANLHLCLLDVTDIV